MPRRSADDEEIAGATHGLDSFIAQLAAQIADVYVDDAIEGAQFATQHDLGETLARNGPACFAYKCFEQRELDAGKDDGPLFQIDLARGGMQLQVAHEERPLFACDAKAAAQDGANAGDEFAGIEWLGQIIVGSDFQAKDAFHIFPFRGEDEDWNIGVLAQLAQQFDAAHAGQHEVEDDEAVLTGASALEAAHAVVHKLGDEFVLPEALRKHLAQSNVVVDDEDSFHQYSR